MLKSSPLKDLESALKTKVPRDLEISVWLQDQKPPEDLLKAADAALMTSFKGLRADFDPSPLRRESNPAILHPLPFAGCGIRTPGP